MKDTEQVTAVAQTIDFEVNDSFVANLPEILSNIAEIKAWVEQATAADRELVLASDEDFAFAEKRCATFNRLIKTLNSKRLDIKRAYMKPVDTFEQAIKEVVAVIEDAHKNLWGQVTDARDLVKQKKQDEYRAYYESMAADCLPYRSFEQVLDTKWLNKGVKPDAVYQAIDKAAESIRADIEIIKSWKSEFELALLDAYRQGQKVSEILGYKNRLEADKVRREQAQATASQPAQTEPATVKAETETKAEQTDTTGNDEVKPIDFRVYCNSQQLQGLKQYLIANNIRYGRVPKSE